MKLQIRSCTSSICCFRLLISFVVTIALFLSPNSVAHAESITITLGGTTTGTGNTWTFVDSQNNIIGKGSTQSSSNVYFISTIIRSWSTDGGNHIIDEFSKAGYNTNFQMPSGGVMWVSWITTQNHWKYAQSTGYHWRYTSKDALSSSLGCWNGTNCPGF